MVGVTPPFVDGNYPGGGHRIVLPCSTNFKAPNEIKAFSALPKFSG